MTAVPHPELPFTEHEDVRTVREQARRLAPTPLALVISGEAGTGKRTIAAQIAESRCHALGARGPIWVTADLGTAGKFDPGSLRAGGTTPAVVVADGAQFLSERDQAALAWLARDGHALLIFAATTPTDSSDVVFQHELQGSIAANLRLPPLRNRGADVVEWAGLFLGEVAQKLNRELRWSAQAEEAIARYSWPGNLSELRNRVERAAALSDNREIGADHLGLAEASDVEIVPLAKAVEDFRRQYVLSTLERFGGNRSQAARALGVDVRTIFRMLEKEPKAPE